MKNITKNQKSLAIVSLVFVSMFVCATIFGTKTVYAVVPVPNIAIEPTTEKPYVLETPFPFFEYYIKQYSNGSKYVINGSNYNNINGLVTTNSTYIFENVIGNITSGVLYVSSGIYDVDTDSTDSDNIGCITLYNKHNITVIFEKGAVINAPTDINNTVILIKQCTNIKIIGGEIYGGHDYVTDNPTWNRNNGITLDGSSYCTIEDMWIHNCKQTGILISGHQGNSINNKIINSVFNYNGWNGITVGEGGSYDNSGNMVYGNIISYSSDVGISVYSEITSVYGNSVFEITGTTGSLSDSGWGIGLESGVNCTIQNNIVKNCKYGIVDDDYIGNRLITNNLICGNVISNCTNYSICLQEYCGNDLVSHNTIHLNGVSSSVYGIYVNGVMNNSFVGNSIIIGSGAEYSKAVRLENANYTHFKDNIFDVRYSSGEGGISMSISDGTDGCFFIGNTFISKYSGVTLASGCDNNHFIANDFSRCNTVWYDSGSGNTNNCYVASDGYHA